MTEAIERRQAAGAAMVSGGLLTRRDLADLLQVSVRTVDRLVQRGALPEPDGPKLGRVTRWRAATVKVVVVGGDGAKAERSSRQGSGPRVGSAQASGR